MYDGSPLYRLFLAPMCKNMVRILVIFFPEKFNPNIITLFGAMCALMTLFLCKMGTTHQSYYHYACISLLTSWLCDNLDGIYARSTCQCSKFGKFLDHFIDSTISQSTIFYCILNFVVVNINNIEYYYFFLVAMTFLSGQLYEMITNKMCIGTNYITSDEINLFTLLILLFQGYVPLHIYENFKINSISYILHFLIILTWLIFYNVLEQNQERRIGGVLCTIVYILTVFYCSYRKFFSKPLDKSYLFVINLCFIMVILMYNSIFEN